MSQQESDQMIIFFEAAKTGDVSTLKSLVREKSQMLHKISLSDFTETPLHISSSLGHREFTEELLSLNRKLATELVPSDDFKTLEMRVMLNGTEQQTSTPNIKTTQLKGWRKILRFVARMLSHNDTNWLEEMRGNLSLVAIMISTITFQALINPPGGFVQQDIASDEGPFGCLVDYGGHGRPIVACPGDAVSAVASGSYFLRYLKYNSICFVGSLWVTLLLVSGVPLKHKPVIWALSMGMCATLTFLTLTYLQALFMVSPAFSLFVLPNKMILGSVVFWFGILGVAALWSTLRFAFWLMEKGKEKFNCRRIIFCHPWS